MKKDTFSIFSIGLIIGALFFGGYFAWAQVSQHVGIYARDTGGGWRMIRDATNFQQGATGNNNTGVLATGIMTQGNNSAWNPVTAAFQDGIATNAPGLPGFQLYTRTSAGTFSRAVSYDRARNANDSFNALGVGLYIPAAETGSNFRMAASGGYTQPVDGNNILLNSPTLRDPATNNFRSLVSAASIVGETSSGNGTLSNAALLFNGSNYDRRRGVSATTLTETVSQGVQLNAPLSTWSVTSTPAAATQATASKAAGVAGVRHVATSITACYAGTVSGAPIQVNLRDGTTGAGTILRSWLLAFPSINDGRCVDLSNLAMIGTSATAMTLEFAAAGAANTNQTVTLTGYSVN